MWALPPLLANQGVMITLGIKKSKKLQTHVILIFPPLTADLILADLVSTLSDIQVCSGPFGTFLLSFCFSDYG